jgi:putative spermidine/putrescine transport system ATP-binding protein
VFQDLRLFPHMTVAENIAFPLKMKGTAKKEAAATARELLEKVQLEGFEERKIREMSGGQMQRVALARALAAKPNVLLLDEPFSSLDENLRQDMRKLVLKLQRDYGITTVLVTHDRQEALSMSDKIALMVDGRILQFDTPENIYNFPVNRAVADFFGDAVYADGAVENHIFRCEAGEIKTDKPDGQYQAMIRAGAVCIDPDGGRKDFHIAEINYRGEDYGILLTKKNSGFQLRAVAASSEGLKQGDAVSVSVKPDKVFLFKASGDSRYPEL